MDESEPTAFLDDAMLAESLRILRSIAERVVLEYGKEETADLWSCRVYADGEKLATVRDDPLIAVLKACEGLERRMSLRPMGGEGRR